MMRKLYGVAGGAGGAPSSFVAAARIQAKNGLKSYAYDLRDMLDYDKVAEKAKLQRTVDETISWLDNSQDASKEEYEKKQKILESMSNPIIQMLYRAGTGLPGTARGFDPSA